MTSSPPSGSDGTEAFARLRPEIRKWIWEKKWQELKEVQVRTISAVLDGGDDVLVMAATAAGKTEAAFLPILTDIGEAARDSMQVLYVSPLKALINDQFLRLEELCESMEIPTVRWHGDAPQAAKSRMMRAPAGIALITPESIEALFVRRPAVARRLFAGLRYIVIDELHSFLQGPRGLHLASLLGRIDAVAETRPRRVGLSATIGDASIAAAWLHPESPGSVVVIDAASGGAELKLQVRGYEEPAEADGVDTIEDEEKAPRALDRIADHMFSCLRGSNNLVFANSRRRVEALSDRLRRRSEKSRVPNEFFPHHGSLSKELREDLEKRLKAGDLPTTAIATTTLELGIDIGSVKSIAQTGAPRSLSSLRQRLGRSGRRAGAPAILRVYVTERYRTDDADLPTLLRLETAQSVAAVRLLVQKFIEPPSAQDAVLTVALQQTLSVIAERGGERPERLYRTLCAKGPLSVLEARDYAALLRDMATEKLLEQASDGLLMLGEEGEKLVEGRDFYAIFESDAEWKLVSSGATLGTIPLSNLLGVGSLVAFAGRRWRVTSVDAQARILEVEPYRAAVIPTFDRLSRESIHDRLAAEMKRVYLDTDMPAYLDERAGQFLMEGRSAFSEFDLGRRPVIERGGDAQILLWRGTLFSSIFAAAIGTLGHECAADDILVTIADAGHDDAREALRRLAEEPPPAEKIVRSFENLADAKYDGFISDDLLARIWTRMHSTQCAEIGDMARDLLRQCPQ